MATASSETKEDVDSLLFAVHAAVSGVAKAQLRPPEDHYLERVQQWLASYGWNGSADAKDLLMDDRVDDRAQHFSETSIVDFIRSFPLSGSQFDALRASISCVEQAQPSPQSIAQINQSNNGRKAKRLVLPRAERKVSVHDSHQRTIQSSRLLEDTLLLSLGANFINVLVFHGSEEVGFAFASFAVAVLTFAVWLKHHQYLNWHGEWLHVLAPARDALKRFTHSAHKTNA